ncbi:MAG: UMP kinase [Nanoarchaeota archaeon]|nr:UMP kinase [Nanoarchaeota archaeon]
MKTIVISVGGSMINPGKVNIPFLKKIKEIILNSSKKNKIVICTGGGAIAREYINALKDKNTYTKDIMGIHCTMLNAKLLASTIEKCNQEIPRTLEEVKDNIQSFNIVICGGLRPGTTSDGTTAAIADYLNADMLINMTNVKGLYTKDPNKHKDAKFIPKISHKDFKVIMDKVQEKPGQHFILDSLAAKICREENIDVVILRGINNLKKLLENKKYQGTLIS